METPGPSFTKLFRGTKLVNSIKRHSAANFERQNHVVNGFVKLASALMDGCKFSSFSTVSQSYQMGNWVIMDGWMTCDFTSFLTEFQSY